MRILVTGASGYVGSALIPVLLADGHRVRALGRDDARVRRTLAQLAPVEAQGPEIVVGDVLAGTGLDEALDGVQVAYYLVHSMEASEDGPFPVRERRSAENFAAAARRQGVRRVIYLGGLLPSSGTPSPHLASRVAVEQILLESAPAPVALRASIVIGARSRSFRFLVRLVERLPVLALPSWRENRTAPIDERDLLACLGQCATSPAVRGQSLDLAGPDVLTYGEMILRIADHMLVGRPPLRLGFSATSLTGSVAAAVAGERPELILPLMEGLRGDLLPRDDRATQLLPVRRHRFDAAVEHALREWERREPLAAR
jgi:uncharacterized protein YbjT (DUF2867 family)